MLHQCPNARRAERLNAWDYVIQGTIPFGFGRTFPCADWHPSDNPWASDWELLGEDFDASLGKLRGQEPSLATVVIANRAREAAGKD